MFRQTSYTDRVTFFQKIRSLDYILLLCILFLGLISSLSMYSTDGGEFFYHTKSHISRFVIFFSFMLLVSFVNIKFWHSVGYIFYIIVLGLYYGHHYMELRHRVHRDGLIYTLSIFSHQN